MTAAVEALARRAARGDGEAFEAVCRALSDDVWRYCVALAGDRELGFEAAQETFVRLVGAIRRFRGDAPVRVYTLAIARRAVAEVLRRERRHAHADLDRSPEPVAVDQRGVAEVADLVRALPHDQRQAFVLTQVVGLPYEEAAAVAGCAVGTIRSRVFRARERLVAALEPPEEESDVR
jgi:RNA polymerase sigma-70 factor, ECF subfamily